MQICTSPQTDNHASIPPFNFLQARCPSCCSTNSVKALKAQIHRDIQTHIQTDIYRQVTWIGLTQRDLLSLHSSNELVELSQWQTHKSNSYRFLHCGPYKTRHFITSAEEGGYVFGSVCLSVCLFVYLSIGLLANL